MDSAHAGHLPWEQSFLDVTPDNVEVLAVKRAENSEDSTVIRLQERAGASATAIIRSAALGFDHNVALRPWEIKTLIVKRQSNRRAEVRETSSIEV